MPNAIVDHATWIAERKALLAKEKAFTRARGVKRPGVRTWTRG